MTSAPIKEGMASTSTLANIVDLEVEDWQYTCTYKLDACIRKLLLLQWWCEFKIFVTITGYVQLKHLRVAKTIMLIDALSTKI